MRYHLLLVFALVASFLQSSDALAVDVSRCGTIVSDAVLTADLDCSASPWAIALLDRGTLDLAGHTLVAGTEGAVSCPGGCTIEGNGGAIVGGSHAVGIRAQDAGARVYVSNVAISGFAVAISAKAAADVSNCVISDISASAIHSNNVTATNCSISGSGWSAISAWRRAVVTNCEISGSDMAITVENGKAIVTASTLSDNATCGIWARAVLLSDSTVSNSGCVGVTTGKIRAQNSVVHGSGSGLSCSFFAPGERVDIASSMRPRLLSVDCDTSADMTAWKGDPTGESWRTCALD